MEYDAVVIYSDPTIFILFAMVKKNVRMLKLRRIS